MEKIGKIYFECSAYGCVQIIEHPETLDKYYPSDT